MNKITNKIEILTTRIGKLGIKEWAYENTKTSKK
jgi:hypothetical protein